MKYIQTKAYIKKIAQTKISISDVEKKLLEMGEPGLVEAFGRAVKANDINEIYYFSLAANGNKAALEYLNKKYIWAQPIK